MLTQEESVDVHALRRQGWSISAIARHVGRDRKTVRAYLNGERTPGVRLRRAADPFEGFEAYVARRLADDPHVWAVVLFDEVSRAGYPGAYSTFTRQLRTRRLRPPCEACHPTRDRPAGLIDHPPGEEVQWDWVDLPDPPQAWGWGPTARLLVGTLPYSGRWRAVLAPSMDQPHLIDALDRVCRALGGLARRWRFDRMATVCHPGSGQLTASFAAVATHYGVGVDICPPRRGNRKGSVEKANHGAAQRWWRTLAEDLTVEAAQADLDAFCARVVDTRRRVAGGARATVAAHARDEALTPVTMSPFPAVLVEDRTVSAQALVSWRGNRYSVPPQLAHAQVQVLVRLGEAFLDIATTTGTVIARHRAAPVGAGATVRTDTHIAALEHAVLAAFTTEAPHRRKERRPPTAEALALLPARPHTTVHDTDVVVDLAAYAAAARGRNTLK